jgi:hypothetical protein
MSLNKKEVNFLNALDLRKLNFIPDHFQKITLNYKVDIRSVERWIEYYLNSRYSIKHILMLDNNKKIIHGTVIGLEDSKELSILTLGCNFLIRKDF